MPDTPEPPHSRPDRADPEHPPTAPGAHHQRWHRRRASTPAPRPAPPGYLRWDPRHRRWRNAALRIDGRTTVHAIRPDPTDDGGQRVAPACHTGHDRSDDSPTLQPVYDQPVTCGSCLRKRIAHEDGQAYDPNRNQWVLPGMPELECFPPDELGAGESSP